MEVTYLITALSTTYKFKLHVAELCSVFQKNTGSEKYINAWRLPEILAKFNFVGVNLISYNNINQ